MKDILNSLLTLIYSDDGSVFSIVGSAKVKDPAEPAKLEVSFYESNPLSLKIVLNIHFLGDSTSFNAPISLTASPPGPYWVLSTDYEGHTLVYSCSQFGPFSAELSWILSREPTLSKETIQQLHSILSSVGVDVDKMVPTIQDETYCRAMDQ